jgi:hypothetical protein
VEIQAGNYRIRPVRSMNFMNILWKSNYALLALMLTSASALSAPHTTKVEPVRTARDSQVPEVLAQYERNSAPGTRTGGKWVAFNSRLWSIDVSEHEDRNHIYVYDRDTGPARRIDVQNSGSQYENSE